MVFLEICHVAERDREWHDSAACQVQGLCFAVLHTPNPRNSAQFLRKKKNNDNNWTHGLHQRDVPRRREFLNRIHGGYERKI